MVRRRKRALRIPIEARPFISQHIRRHMRVYGMPQRQAVAIALHEARSKGFKVPLKAVKEADRRAKLRRLM